jgi:Domain of unknown function (DUF4136)
MIHPRHIPILLLLLTSLLHAADVETDFDPAVDFSHYKTFSFIGGKELTRTGLLSDPSMRDRIENFISGAVGLRGLQEIPNDEKYDLAVRFWVAREQKTDETVVLNDDFGFAGYPAFWTGPWGWSYEEYVVHDYVEGTLVIDLIDPRTRELVWRTFLRQKIEDRAKAYEDAKKNLEKSFAQFPPSAEEKGKMRGQREKLSRKYGASDVGQPK